MAGRSGVSARRAAQIKQQQINRLHSSIKRSMSSQNFGISLRHVNRDAGGTAGTLYNYPVTSISSTTAYLQREKVANRAWDLYINDAATKGLIDTLAVDIVGHGLTPIANPMTDFLGFDAEWEEEFEQITRDWWEIWGLSPFKWCDLHRRMSINQMMAWAVLSWKIEGIALFIPVMLKESPFRPFSLALQPISAHRLKTPIDLSNESDIYDGVRVDNNGTPVSYFIKKFEYDTEFDIDTSNNYVEIPAYNKVTGRPNIIACYRVENISNYRSESALTAIVKTLRDRHDHKDAALVGAIVANLFTIFLKNGLSSIDPTTGLAIREPIQEINAGTIMSGAAGEEPTVIKTDRPGPHFKDMDHSSIEELGMSTGRGFEKILKKWEASFSASRMSVLQASKFDEVDRDMLISGFCDQVRMLLLEEAALRGYIKVKSIEDFYFNTYPYTRCRWLPPAQGDIDPVKGEKADELALKNESKTLADISAERGEWWKDKIKEKAKVKAYRKKIGAEYGVDLDEQPATTAPSSNTDDSEEGDE